MKPPRLLVIAPEAAALRQVKDALSPIAADVVWHAADDGAVFVGVLSDGLWDGLIFFGHPRRYVNGLCLDIVRAYAPNLPFVVVTAETTGDAAAQALLVGARAWIPAAALSALGGIIAGMLAEKSSVRGLGNIADDSRRRSERYRGLIELSPEPLAVHRRGLILYVNAPAADLLGGVDAEALIGRSMFDLIHPDDHAVVVQRAQRVWAIGERNPPGEIRLILPDGSYRHVEAAAWPIVYEDEPANLVLLRDITERRQAEESRQQLLQQEREARAAADVARERLAFLVEASSVVNANLDHVATLDNMARSLVPRLATWCIVDQLQGDGRLAVTTILHTKAGGEARIRQIRAEHPINLSSDQLVARVIRSGKSELIADLQRFDLDVSPDRERFRTSQTAGDHSIICVPLIARDRVLGTMTLGAGRDRRPYDADDLALAEELAHKAALALDNALLYRDLQEADRRKEEFLGLLGHELRNPLAGTRNAVHLLRRQADRPEQVLKWVEVIDRQQRLLSRLVEDLLDVSRINSGKITLNREPTDLAAVIRESVESLADTPSLACRQISVEVPAVPVLVDGDPMRIAQMVMNLLDNAGKYNVPDGRIILTLTVAGTQARLDVADTGLGIAPERLPDIFDPFVQLSVGDRTKPGLGLGLTLVRRLAELHDGSITAASPGEGAGSVFTLRLPLVGA